MNVFYPYEEHSFIQIYLLKKITNYKIQTLAFKIYNGVIDFELNCFDPLTNLDS
jgi:hypothetical protein